MNKSFSFGIARRLYALSIVISLALVALAGFAYFNLQEAYSKAEQTATVRVPQRTAMADLELGITRVSLQLRHAMLSRTPQELDDTMADIGAKRQLIAKIMGDYEKSLFTERGKAQFAPLPPLMDKFWRIGEENIALIKNGQRAEAFAFLVDKTIPARNELLKAISEGVKYQEEALGDDIRTIESRVHTTSTALLVLVALIAIGLLAFSIWVGGQLRRRVALAQATAERVRDGDLSTSVRDHGRDEFSPLLAALDEMQSSLSRVVADVRGSAESVATTSTQIAQGNEDLSGRTEQQAAALEETNSNTTALGATAQQNADSAHQASQLAASASGVAQQGGQVVSQVVETMKDINESSRKINDIIGVID
ncbi:MCP four helix bundle domain-containing protein, partial [Hydrogenophaga flava]|uniref:MCP four helix bundle domain-containing protein n=1 Tax=Hydrogenophaga flava TaxID=65657 RepID=UPI000B07952B